MKQRKISCAIGIAMAVCAGWTGLAVQAQQLPTVSRLDGTWEGAYACSAMLHRPETSRSPKSYSYPFSMELRRGQFGGFRERGMVEERLAGTLDSSGRAEIVIDGRWKDTGNRWRTRLRGRLAGDTLPMTGVLTSPDGQIKLRDCTLTLMRMTPASSMTGGVAQPRAKTASTALNGARKTAAEQSLNERAASEQQALNKARNKARAESAAASSGGSARQIAADKAAADNAVADRAALDKAASDRQAADRAAAEKAVADKTAAEKAAEREAIDKAATNKPMPERKAPIRVRSPMDL